MDYSNYTAQPQVPQPNTPMFQTQEGYQPQLYEAQGPQMNNYGMAGPGMLPPATGAGYDFNRRNQDAAKRTRTLLGMSIGGVVCCCGFFFLVPFIIVLILLFTVILPAQSEHTEARRSFEANFPK